MKTLRTFLTLTLTVGVICVTVAACGTSASGASTGGTPSNTGRAPTATPAPKAKPTGVPTVSVAYCQGLMTIDEANQIMHPATLATTIRVDQGKSGGSCNWEYAQFKSVVTVLFLPFKQGVSLDAIATQALAAMQSVPGAHVTKTSVTGVGDQALYISATLQTGKGLWEDLLDTTYGSLVLSCNAIGTGAPPAASLQAPLTQVCQQVLSRL